MVVVVGKEYIFMPIFREQPSISPYEHTKSILIRTCVCKVVQQLFIKYLLKKKFAYVNMRTCEL